MRNRIKSCDVCGKRENTKQKHRHAPTKCISSHSFWQFAYDIWGPLAESRENNFILLIDGQFTKCYEFVALPHWGANTIEMLTVVKLQIDQELNFIIKLFRSLLKGLKIERISETSYSQREFDDRKEKSNNRGTLLQIIRPI